VTRPLAAVTALAIGLLLAPATPAGAQLPRVTSDGHLGDINDLGWDPFTIYGLNTDTGAIMGYTGHTGWLTVREGAGRVVSQSADPAAPTLMVFDFSTFTLPALCEVRTFGGRPCVIATTGNVTIAGTMDVASGASAGGAGQYQPWASGRGDPGAGPGGGQGGRGPGMLVRNLNNDNDQASAGGGGGGGGNVSFGSPGRPGNPGLVGGDLWQMGGGMAGPPCGSWTEIRGGSGGGGGGGYISAGPYGGVQGGNGGGALLVCCPTDMTVEDSGLVRANGASAGGLFGPHGGGGGGAGGFLAFAIDGAFENDGILQAMGGQGTPSSAEGYCGGGHGSGGRIYIDPTGILNDGLIDVSGGDLGDPLLLGAVGIDPGMVIQGTGVILGSLVIVPEPTALALLAAGGLGLALRRRR